MGSKQSTWGGGGTSGKRIPDDQDKPKPQDVSKAEKIKLERMASRYYRKMPGKQIEGLVPGMTPEQSAATIRRAKLREVGQSNVRVIGKALPSSATAHMLTKPEPAPSPLTPKSAPPTKTLGLKPTKGIQSSVAKAYRSYDPESSRLHRQGYSQGILAAGGAASAYSGWRAPKERTPIKGIERLLDPRTHLFQHTPADPANNVKQKTVQHPAGKHLSAAERAALESGHLRTSRAAKGKIGAGAAAVGLAAALRHRNNQSLNRQFY